MVQTTLGAKFVFTYCKVFNVTVELFVCVKIMKPEAVTSVVFVEDQLSSSSSFLLQGAIRYAEQGYSVCVISMNEVQSLPPPIHGVVMPGADVFSLIRFVYLSTWQDLLQHLNSIHIHTQVPSVILLESLEKYFIPRRNASSTDDDKMDIDIQHAALICASLMNGAAVCAARLKKQAFLLISLKKSSLLEATLNTILNTFFKDFVWFITTEQAEDDHSDKKVVLTSQNKKYVFTFSHPNDMALYLREMVDATM